MNIVREGLGLVLGTIFGMAASAGMFALITSITVVPRMADKLYIKGHINTFETAIMAGGVFWNCFFLYRIRLYDIWGGAIGNIAIGIIGLFSGMYIGCIAMSLAERLSVSSILTRRIRLHIGLTCSVFFLSLGKLVGALLYFWKNMDI